MAARIVITCGAMRSSGSWSKEANKEGFLRSSSCGDSRSMRRNFGATVAMKAMDGNVWGSFVAILWLSEDHDACEEEKMV
jgi:hypothetical protein